MLEKNKIIEEATSRFLMFGSKEQMSLCQRFFPKKPNKNLDGSLYVFLTLVKMNQNRVQRQQLEEHHSKNFYYDYQFNEDIFENDRIKKNILTDALKILRCNKLIVKDKDGYRINNILIYKGVRYQLKDKEIFTKIVPLMFGYIRTDARLTADNYFRELDKLISYILLLPKLHNKYYNLEENIYQASEDEVKMEITLKGKSKSIRITPISVEIDKQKMKKLHYKLGSSENVRSEFFDNIENVFYPKKEKIDTIFSVNNLLYQHFTNIQHFEEMELYTSKEDMEEVAKKYNINFKKLYLNKDSSKKSVDFFIVKARDTKDNIVNILQQNLQYIQVLQPYSVQKSLQDNIKVFEKNSTEFSNTSY